MLTKASKLRISFNCCNLRIETPGFWRLIVGIPYGLGVLRDMEAGAKGLLFGAINYLSSST
jgi:hypothetical protein